MSIEERRHGAGEDWPRALAYWRRLPAEAFEPELCEEVVSSVNRIASTIEEWRAAIDGDAGAAVGIALKLKVPTVITTSVDLTMTLLLRSAFEDAGAALVLSTRLQQMPLPPVERARLSASWRLHNIYLAWRARRSPPLRKSRRGR
jgi:hypothetical protein